MNETAGGYQPSTRTPVDLPDQEPVPGEEKEQTGLRVAVIVAVVILVLFGLYWGGKLLLMPAEEEVPKGSEGVEVTVDSRCSDPTVYTNINAALGNPGAVCKIDLSGQNLTYIPIEIGYFTELIELDVSDNQISWLPSEIGWLTKLQKFDVSNNKLTALALEIGWLRQLREWDLSNNQITWLPSEIGWLREVEYLNLANNQLAYYIPIEVGWMEKMKTFDLSGNPPEVAGSVEAIRPYMPGANIILP